MDGWVDGWMGGWVDGWMDGWVDGWMGGWVDGWMDNKQVIQLTAVSFGVGISHVSDTHNAVMSKAFFVDYNHK